MPKLRQIIGGVTSNWASYALSVAVAFFLSPYVVNALGKEAYGVWSLIISSIAYIGLLDLGLRGAVTRFVARHHASGDHDEASRAFSGVFWMRVCIGFVAVLSSAALAYALPRVFKVPDELITAARWATVVTGLNLALSMAFGVFGGVLAALHRFPVLSGFTMGQTVLRAVGTVVLLKQGYGLLGLAVWELVVACFINALQVGTTFRIYRELRLWFERPHFSLLKDVWEYSAWVFLINACYQVIYYTDNLIVGAFVSASAVTFYTIAGSLVEYLRQLISAMTSTFMPLASSYQAQGAADKLRNLLVMGTRAALVVALPIEVALFTRGKTFIGLWMGPEFATLSNQVLQVLLIAQFVSIANATSGNIVYGMAMHRPVAKWTGLEAFLNLSISIVLVRSVGMLGVAWATVAAALVTHLAFWPRYVTKVVDMPVFTYLWKAWAMPLIAAMPFAAACLWLETRSAPTSMITFFGQILLSLPIYALCVGMLFRPEIQALIASRRIQPELSKSTSLGT